jgi:hypothetical protein
MPRRLQPADAGSLLRSRTDLRELGLSDRRIASEVAHGRLRRVRPGWYVRESVWRGLWPEGRLLLRVVAVARDSRGGGPVASHASAAVVHGCPLYRLAPQAVDQLVAPDSRTVSGSDVVRHVASFSDDDVCEVDGLLVTTPARTVSDVARTLPLETSLAIADAALGAASVTRHVVDPERAGVWHNELARHIADARGQRGVRQARWIAGFADGRAELPGESVSRLQLHRLGFREIELQVSIPGPDGTSYFSDLGLPQVNAFAEFDGKDKYLDEARRKGITLEQTLLEEKFREDWIRGTTDRRLLRWEMEHIATPATLAKRLTAFGVHIPR